MVWSTSDLMKTTKNTQSNLRKLGQDNGLWSKTTSKTSRKDLQKYSPVSSFEGTMSGDAVDEHVEQDRIELGEGVGVVHVRWRAA